MRRRCCRVSNVDGDNIFLSFVSINSESNVQEKGKGAWIAENGSLR